MIENSCTASNRIMKNEKIECIIKTNSEDNHEILVNGLPTENKRHVSEPVSFYRFSGGLLQADLYNQLTGGIKNNQSYILTSNDIHDGHIKLVRFTGTLAGEIEIKVI